MAMTSSKEDDRKMPKGFLRMSSVPQKADPELRRRLEAELEDLEDGEQTDAG